MFVTFLTDFGLTDDFVGTCHGVIKRIAPDVQILDITHGIPPRAVLQGALVLANTVPYMPIGVHLAVVDPGVGGIRRPLVLRDAEGRLFVGPDNGLLLPAAERAGIVDACELTNETYWIESISRTFHGRDIFSPVAAHLATGVELHELGLSLDPEALVRLDLPEPGFGESLIEATMLYVDSFGNIALNLTRDDVERLVVFLSWIGKLAVDRDAIADRRLRCQLADDGAAAFVARGEDGDVIVGDREGPHVVRPV